MLAAGMTRVTVWESYYFAEFALIMNNLNFNIAYKKKKQKENVVYK